LIVVCTVYISHKIYISVVYYLQIKQCIYCLFNHFHPLEIQHIFIFSRWRMLYKVREYRRGNQKWTIQRNW